jgi:hypothetical protein
MRCSHLPVHKLLCMALVDRRGLHARVARLGYRGPLCCFNTSLQSCTKFIWEMHM